MRKTENHAQAAKAKELGAAARKTGAKRSESARCGLETKSSRECLATVFLILDIYVPFTWEAVLYLS